MPLELAELIAFWIAVVFVVTPSPTAPNAVILLVPGGMTGSAGEAARPRVAKHNNPSAHKEKSAGLTRALFNFDFKLCRSGHNKCPKSQNSVKAKPGGRTRSRSD